MARQVNHGNTEAAGMANAKLRKSFKTSEVSSQGNQPLGASPRFSQPDASAFRLIDPPPSAAPPRSRYGLLHCRQLVSHDFR